MSRHLLCPLILALSAAPALAQFGGFGQPFGGTMPHQQGAEHIQEPSSFRVYQRDENDRASIPIVLNEKARTEGWEVVGAGVISPQQGPGPGGPFAGATFEDGKLNGVPTGGPYSVVVQLQQGHHQAEGPKEEDEGEGQDQTDPNAQPATPGGGFFGQGSQISVSIPSIFVGDLWVLSGQSNMEGVGDLEDVTPPNERVMALGMDGTWKRAEEPLHWLVDSPDPVHSGDPATREERSREAHKTRRKGAGLGLPFAVEMVEATGVPVGLIATAHGGTSMAQWDPSKKDEGGNSLYGSMLRQIDLAGGKVKGMLWYQGESDAMGGAAEVYPQVFTDFIAAVRKDLDQPGLPFYYVQIGRFIIDGDPKGWNAVQEAQRLLPERVDNTAVVATVDLELDDLIHIGTDGQKRLGRRLARVALRELFNHPFGTTPTLDRVFRGPDNTLVVRLKGVNPAWNQSPAQPQTAGGGMGMGAGEGFRQVPASSPAGMGSYRPSLQPPRHIAGFSIRKDDGTEIPLIFDAEVGQARDTVVLRLVGPIPEGASLWYGHGLDPYCNLTDALDMAVPAFGPIRLDEVK